MIKRDTIKYLVFIGLLGLFLAPVRSTLQADEPTTRGVTESTPSRAQYFSWINNTNEGSTEAQTLTNLEFFKWLHDEYGMKLEIYAFDAGNIDGPRYYGSTKTEKFHEQFPRGFQPIYDLAKSFDCRLGVWLGPDGFGDSPEEEQARIDMLAGFCKDYDFELFKMDAVCTQLRPGKQPAFERLMIECRKHSPELILLNHRLNLGDAEKYATTFLWGGAETYIDVHMVNRRSTGTHNRVQALSRGLVPDLKRLTEDHGVCISSCLDFWDDDLILQAFNRNLILAPEIYANPWFLRDDEFPKLARIYNLHRRYRDIMVNGMVLDEEQYGVNAVSRGDDKTRLISLRNLDWEPAKYTIKLDDSIGLTANGTIELRQFHPTEKIIGQFKAGDEVEIEVLPFRSCLVLADTAKTGGIGLVGCDYEIVRDVPGKDVIIKVLGGAGETANISLASGGRQFSKATLDSVSQPDLASGNELSVTFPGELNRSSWHTHVGEPTVILVPADAEAVFESSCFAADNDPLEVRSIRRSGETKVPQVAKARQAFMDQEIIVDRGILQDYLFDNDSETVYNFQHRVGNVDSRALRLDLGEVAKLDYILLQAAPGPGVLPTKVSADNVAAVSSDLINWTPARLQQDGDDVRVVCDPALPVRYIRTDLRPGKLAEIRGFANSQELDRSHWRMSWLFPAPREAKKAWSLAFDLDHAVEGGYLAVACNGPHGREGAWVGLKVDGRYVGAPDRAPSYPVNPWEYPVGKSTGNYSYYIPVTADMIGKKCELVVLGYDAENLGFQPDLWLTSYPIPFQQKTLVLSE
ncbi:hypothetical protein [Neorhodopirellula lusitana]|uniref:hypothetical protein n=1 Tax=Neorhodopirellula lusitana TaxID=445327 RepID=UPI00384F5E80